MNGQTKALFDVSVLVDALINVDQTDQDSATALGLAVRGDIEGYLSASAIEYLSDFLIRAHGLSGAKEKLNEIRRALAVAPVGAEVVDAAVALDWQYLDDALTYQCARINGMDAVVTLNPLDFSDPALSVLAPSDLLQRLNS